MARRLAATSLAWQHLEGSEACATIHLFHAIQVSATALQPVFIHSLHWLLTLLAAAANTCLADV